MDALLDTSVIIEMFRGNERVRNLYVIGEAVDTGLSMEPID